ncbi:hypothetical protein D3C80_1149120 [compost metagenome]
MTEQRITNAVLRTQRVKQKIIAVAISAAAPKNIITWTRPSIRSPTSLAKPITRILIGPLPSSPTLCALAEPANSNLLRNCSSSVREKLW